jgi:UDP-3-O-[3-hydroxymyristoyl] glucosamine N-acyltransferase
MSEPVFLRETRGLTLDEIVALTGAAVTGAPARGRRFVNVAPLDRAAPADLSFFDNKGFSADAARTHAGACLTSAALAATLPQRVTALVVAEPYRAFVTVARALFPQSLRPSTLAEPGETLGAHVHATARLESGVTVEPGAVIGPRAEIGAAA